MQNISDIEMNVELLEKSPKKSDPNSNGKTSETPIEKHRFVKLPLSRIKHIMKIDPDSQLISQDAVVLVTKATELFLEHLAREAAKVTLSSKRKTMMKKDVDHVIDTVNNLCFLDGAME